MIKEQDRRAREILGQPAIRAAMAAQDRILRQLRPFDFGRLPGVMEVAALPDRFAETVRRTIEPIRLPEGLQEAIQATTRRFADLVGTPTAFEALRTTIDTSALSRLVADIPAPAVADLFERSATVRLVREVQAAAKLDDFTRFEAALRACEERLTERIRESEARLSASADAAEQRAKARELRNLVISVVLTLLVALLQQLTDQTDEHVQRLEDRVVEMEQRLLASLAEIESRTALAPSATDTPPATYYVVERPVHLRVAPSTKSRSLLVLPRNQRVRLLERNREWIRVEYLDFLDQEWRLGWVFKKYLKRLPPDSSTME